MECLGFCKCSILLLLSIVQRLKLLAESSAPSKNKNKSTSFLNAAGPKNRLCRVFRTKFTKSNTAVWKSNFSHGFGLKNICEKTQKINRKNKYLADTNHWLMTYSFKKQVRIERRLPSPDEPRRQNTIWYYIAYAAKTSRTGYADFQRTKARLENRISLCSNTYTNICKSFNNKRHDL